MIESGSARNYIFYALGEIALVVIGILIALQVNNWNQEAIAHKKELSILQELRSGILQDTVSMNFDIQSFTEIRDHANYLSTMFESDNPYESKMDTSLGVISVFGITKINDAIYEDIKLSGFELIGNEDLRRRIISYYKYANHIWDVERYYENGKYFRREIYPKYFKKYKFGRLAVPNDYKSLRKSGEFLIALDYCINDAQFYKRELALLKEEAVKILQILDKELAD